MKIVRIVNSPKFIRNTFSQKFTRFTNKPTFAREIPYPDAIVGDPLLNTDGSTILNTDGSTLFNTGA